MPLYEFHLTCLRPPEHSAVVTVRAETHYRARKHLLEDSPIGGEIRWVEEIKVIEDDGRDADFEVQQGCSAMQTEQILQQQFTKDEVEVLINKMTREALIAIANGGTFAFTDDKDHPRDYIIMMSAYAKPRLVEDVIEPFIEAGGLWDAIGPGMKVSVTGPIAADPDATYEQLVESTDPFYRNDVSRFEFAKRHAEKLDELETHLAEETGEHP